MKKYFVLVAALVGLLVAASKVSASHSMGADLQIQHISGLQYQVSLAFYRDCAGITPSSSFTVNANSSCGNTTLTVNLVGTQSEVSPLCPSQLPNSTCGGGGSQPGVEQWLYQGTVTLPVACADWVFSFQTCTRNNAITTLAGPGGECIYVEAGIDNLNAPGNSTPVFTTLPVPYVCVNQPFTYNHGAIDPDGDSLVYSLIDALDAAGNPVAYTTGFSGTNPMTSSPGVTIDPLNGNINILPTATQVAVLAVLVEEYRNGVLIGSTMRDIQINVLSCTNASTVISPLSNVTGGILTSPTSIEVCPGVPITFDIPGSDPNDGLGDSLFISWNNGIPGGVFTPDADIDTVTGTFSWTPTVADAGYNSFTVNLRDNGCPVLAASILAVDIFVFDGTQAGPDRNYCTAGSPISISPLGGTNFTWNIISGDGTSLSCTNGTCDTVILTPNITTTYEVTSNFSCNNVDTVTVNVVPSFTLNTTSDTTICGGANFAISSLPTPGGGYGAYSWDWNPGTSLSDDTLFNPVASPTDTTTYIVEVSSAAGCVLYDTMTMNVANVVINSNPIADPVQACNGDPVLLDAQVSLASCDGYSSNNIPYAPLALSSPTILALGDEQTSGSQNIGFDFDFYCNTFNTFNVSSNGWIMFFLQAPNGNPQIIPTPGGNADNFIALAWDDLNPGAGGTIAVETQGVAPNRVCIIDFDSVPHFFCSTCFVDAQILLYEGSNIIEFHNTVIDNNGGPMVQGIEDGSGTDGDFRPGRNFQVWTANMDAYQFVPNPPIPFTATWESPFGSTVGAGDSLVVTPASNTRYYSRVEAAGGACLLIDSVDVEFSTLTAGLDDCITTLDSTVLAGSYTGPSPPNNCNIYDIASITFDTTSIAGVATSVLPLANNEVTPRIPIGFPFTFFCNTRDSFQISSNGWITFTNTTDSDRSEDLIPSTNGVEDHIAAAWDDLDPSIGGASMKIEYATIGTSPNQQLVVNFYDVPHRSFPDSMISVQLRLYETTNVIEWHNVSIENDGAQITQGIEDPTGTQAFALPGRNKANFTASNDAFSMTPQLGLLTFSWSPGDSLSDSTAAAPIAFPDSPTTFVLTVDNGVCVMTDTVFLDVSGSCGLSVEGLQLAGQEVGATGALSWKTDFEESVDRFDLMRSRDGSSYDLLHSSDSQGNGRSKKTYRFDDLKPFPGANHYRVQATTVDGEQFVSNVVTLNFTSEQDDLIAVYPNPGSGEFNFDFALSEPGRMEVQVFDLAGRPVWSPEGQTVEAGVHSQLVDLSGLSQGVYLYRVRTGATVHTGKLQIVK